MTNKETNIPVPKRYIMSVHYEMCARLEVGESYFVPVEDTAPNVTLLRQRMIGKTFTARTKQMDENGNLGIRIWRTK